LADEKVRAAYKRVGADPAEPAAPEVFAARAKRDGERWAPLIRRLNLVAE
jgi:tripartite-type tricarboxylate transporter receptor subunit TctC